LRDEQARRFHVVPNAGTRTTQGANANGRPG
jgi:hypothetical protein